MHPRSVCYFLYVKALLVLCLLTRVAAAGLDDCLIAQPVSGYGADGPYTVSHDSLPMTRRAYNRAVHTFRPRETTGPVPVVFLCPAQGVLYSEQYDLLIRHIVSRGYAVIFPSIRQLSFTRAQLSRMPMAYEGFDDAVAYLGPHVDTTRIGFVGHGYGSCVALSIARDKMLKSGWGSAGAFLFLMAPWYPYAIDVRELRAFPPTAKVVVQVYADDYVNDPRIAQYIFDNIGVPAADKDFMIVYSDRRGRCRMRADNDVPLSGRAFGGRDDALDFYGVFKIHDALAAHAFYGESGAYEIALGHGSDGQRYMGLWPDSTPVRAALVTDTPAAHLPSAYGYISSWNSQRNPVINSKALRKVWKVYTIGSFRKLGGAIRRMADIIRRNRGDAMADLEIMTNPIVTGYGADSCFNTVVDNTPNPVAPQLDIYCFRPDGLSTLPPVVFFTPGYSGSDPYMFQPLIEHIVSRGIAVIFSPYPIMPTPRSFDDARTKRDVAWYGYETAIKRWGSLVDTNRVGFMGQSFGGGLTPSIAYTALAIRGWGKDGAFMYLTAPWYCVDMTDEQLRSFPPQTKVLIQVFDDDRVNDHQMAVDLFYALGVPDSNKEFVRLYSDSLDGYVMRADHFVPFGANYVEGQQNLLDYFGIYRFVDALADYAFTGNPDARRIAFGRGSALQRYMGEWAPGRPVRELDETSTPEARHPQLRYMWAWDNQLNPRRGPMLRFQQRQLTKNIVDTLSE